MTQSLYFGLQYYNVYLRAMPVVIIALVGYIIIYLIISVDIIYSNGFYKVNKSG
jgi:hypothetical protein